MYTDPGIFLVLQEGQKCISSLLRDHKSIYGYIHNTINDIEVELKKEMNKRDRHEAKKIRDRYTARHAVLLHTRAEKEEVIANTIKIDFDYGT